IANGSATYTPPKHLEKFRNDLSILPIYFGDAQDIVLIDGAVPRHFLEGLEGRGWNLPMVINRPEDIPTDLLPIKKLSPWGWSPAIIRRMQSFTTLLGESNETLQIATWNEELKVMMSRLTGQKLSQMLKSTLLSEEYISIPEVALRVDNMSQLINMEREMTTPILLKTPWSASGRGLFKIRSRDENVVESNWIKSKFKQQGFLMAEPFLNKIQDLSFHFKKEGGRVVFLGTTFFKSESDGRFMGCYIGFPELEVFNDFPLQEVIEQASNLLHNSLCDLKEIEDYNGYIGVDAMFFFDDQDVVKLHPCIEVNLRYTMGLLNLFLRKRVHPDATGFWNIIAVDEFEASTFLPADNLVFKNGLLASGKLPLTPPPKQGGFMSVLTVDS
ncbi:MAG TPA: hypothetical protein VJ855_06375, partial [Marinilabiliaceae bacterium]|nr:hypothetical protein [Marinilabiliaceae bacterium]